MLTLGEGNNGFVGMNILHFTFRYFLTQFAEMRNKRTELLLYYYCHSSRSSPVGIKIPQSTVRSKNQNQTKPIHHPSLNKRHCTLVSYPFHSILGTHNASPEKKSKSVDECFPSLKRRRGLRQTTQNSSSSLLPPLQLLSQHLPTNLSINTPNAFQPGR